LSTGGRRFLAAGMLATGLLTSGFFGGPSLAAAESETATASTATVGAARAENWDARRPILQLTAESLRFGNAPARSTFGAFDVGPPLELTPPSDAIPIANAGPETFKPSSPEPFNHNSNHSNSAAGTANHSSGLGWRSPVIPTATRDGNEQYSPVRQASYPSLGPAQDGRTSSRGTEDSRSNSAFDDPFLDRSDSQAVQQPAVDQPAPAFGDDATEELPPRPPVAGELRLGPTTDADESGRFCRPEFNNDRDCCAELKVCRTARDLVRSATLDRISVDITPRFLPDENDPVEEHRRQADQLGRSPDRVWRDKDGREVARGRMADFARGRVQVVDPDGQTTEVPFNDLHTEDLCFVTAWWSLPSECGLGLEKFQGRDWIPLTMTWKASAVCNKPLYFEEVQLERYGHTTGPIVQPVLSAAHFFVNIAVLPYKAGIHPPHECQYALGYYRPGSCAPWLLPPVPLSLRGAVAEAAAVGAVIAVLAH
jgi:hypothetical protein